MSELKVPFGLRNGVLHYVSEVETGLACNCLCPDPTCAKPLIARNQPSPTRKRAPYFAHSSQSSGCGGRESALHQQGKEVVERASRLMLPAWSALDGELRFSASLAILAPGSAQEVRLVQGQVRPDVRVSALSSQAMLPTLYVEIKVSHAVDWTKRERVVAAGLSMMEIDLSDVPDEDLQDRTRFEHRVLEQPENRQWIHIASPSFLASMSGHSIIQVQARECREKRVSTKQGNQLLLSEQAMLRFDTGASDPVSFDGELASYVKGTQSVDYFGNHLPYREGLYVLGREPGRGYYYDNTHFKTQLRPIVQDVPWNAQKLLL